MIEFVYRTPGTGEIFRFATSEGWKGLCHDGRKVADARGEREVRDTAKRLIRSLPLLCIGSRPANEAPRGGPAGALEGR